MSIKPLEGFTFGCDPELFVFNDKGEPVSAHPYIPGTKAAPYKVPGGAIQLDGTAAEFNIDPVRNFTDFNNNIKKVLSAMKRFIPKDYTFQCVPHVVYSEAEWDKIPDENKELGCSPDFNAWTGDVNPPPAREPNSRLCTASGHLHIGWTKDMELDNIEHLRHCNDLVKQLDWYLGGWSLSQDPDKVRRNLYGKAGALRYKSYVKNIVTGKRWHCNEFFGR